MAFQNIPKRNIQLKITWGNNTRQHWHIFWHKHQVHHSQDFQCPEKCESNYFQTIKLIIQINSVLKIALMMTQLELQNINYNLMKTTYKCWQNRDRFLIINGGKINLVKQWLICISTDTKQLRYLKNYKK